MLTKNSYRRLSLIPLLLAAAVFAACAAHTLKTTETQEWKGRMQEFASQLYILFPLVSDPVSFKELRNHGQIDSSLSFLASRAHDMTKQTLAASYPSVDPGVASLAASFKQGLTSAVLAFRKGDNEYARAVTYSALQMCIQCHSQKPNASGSRALFDPQALAAMKPLYRADWYAASRNFREALDTYEEIISDSQFAKADPIGWERAAVEGVNIAVSVKQDADESAKVVSQILHSPSAPHFLFTRAQAWKEQIGQWKNEGSDFSSKGDKLTAAKKLMLRKNADPSTNVKHSYINLLRASSLLHAFLQENSDPLKSAQAYLLLGNNYETLSDPNQIILSKNYYKSCISIAPHTNVASRCYDNYEELVYMDSLGGMTTMQESTIEHLDYLRALATP